MFGRACCLFVFFYFFFSFAVCFVILFFLLSSCCFVVLVVGGGVWLTVGVRGWNRGAIRTPRMSFWIVVIILVLN